MVEEMADGDGALVGGELGDVFPDVVREIDLAVECEEDGCGGGELLGDGAGLEDRFRLVGDVVLELGPSECAREARRAGTVDSHRASGTRDRVPACEDTADE